MDPPSAQSITGYVVPQAARYSIRVSLPDRMYAAFAYVDGKQTRSGGYLPISDYQLTFDINGVDLDRVTTRDLVFQKPPVGAPSISDSGAVKLAGTVKVEIYRVESTGEDYYSLQSQRLNTESVQIRQPSDAQATSEDALGALSNTGRLVKLTSVLGTEHKRSQPIATQPFRPFGPPVYTALFYLATKPQMGFLGCDVDQCAPPNVEGIVFFKPASTTAATVSNPSPPVEGAAAPPRHRRRHHNASAAAAPSVFSSTAAPTNVATPPSEVAPPTESAPSSPEPAKAAPPPDNAEASSTKRTRPSKLAELIDAIAEGSTESQLATITDPDLRERRRLAMRAAVGSDSLELVGAAATDKIGKLAVDVLQEKGLSKEEASSLVQDITVATA